MPRREIDRDELKRSREQEAQRIEGLSPGRVDIFLQAAHARRSSLDQMMWQVPALSLTAQSFLLTIALGHDTRWIARVTTALLGMIAAGAAIQLLLKHRYHELLYSHWLEKFEAAHKLPQLDVLHKAEAFAFDGSAHDWKEDARDPPMGTLGRHAHNVRRWAFPFRSPHVWITALSLFLIADGVVLGAWLAHLICHRLNAFG